MDSNSEVSTITSDEPLCPSSSKNLSVHHIWTVTVNTHARWIVYFSQDGPIDGPVMDQWTIITLDGYGRSPCVSHIIDFPSLLFPSWKIFWINKKKKCLVFIHHMIFSRSISSSTWNEGNSILTIRLIVGKIENHQTQWTRIQKNECCKENVKI